MAKEIIPKSLEQACIHMEDKELGEVESVGNHDIGIFVVGMCNINNKPCSNFIPDTPYDYHYNPMRCTTYGKMQREKYKNIIN